jgi:hypothetical protein
LKAYGGIILQLEVNKMVQKAIFNNKTKSLEIIILGEKKNCFYPHFNFSLAPPGRGSAHPLSKAGPVLPFAICAKTKLQHDWLIFHAR